MFKVTEEVLKASAGVLMIEPEVADRVQAGGALSRGAAAPEVRLLLPGTGFYGMIPEE